MAFCVPRAFYPTYVGAYTVPQADPYTEGEFVTPSPLIPPVGPISGVSVTNITTTGFQASLNAVPRATNYQFAWGSFLENETLPSAIFSNLPPNTSNDLVIRAYNEDGTITSSPTAVSTLLPAPNPPGGLTAQSITSTGFQLDWIPSPYASSYTALWGAVPGDVSGTSATFSNLPPATTSNCIVTASNASGSAQSGPYPVLTAIPPPNAPTGVSANSITSNSFQSTWAAVPYASSYTANWTTATSGTYAGVVGGTNASFTVLPVDTSGSLTITATNTSGSATSTPVTVMTLLPPPFAPTGLAASSISNTSFTALWNPAPYASSYTAQWGAYSGSVVGTEATFTSLPSNTLNNLVVTASNASGTAASDPYPVQTANAVSPPAAPTGLTVTRRGVDYFNATWSNVPDVTYSATVNASTVGVSVSSNTVSVTGLIYNSDSNSLIVSASNAGGVTPSSPLYVDLLEAQLVSFTGGLSDPPFPVGTSSGTITTFTIPSDFDVTRNDTSNPEFITAVGSKVFYDTPVPDGTAFSYYMLEPPLSATNSYTFLTDSNVGSDVCPGWTTSNAWSYLAPGQTWEFQYLVVAPNEFQLGTDIMYQFTYNPFSNA